MGADTLDALGEAGDGQVREVFAAAGPAAAPITAAAAAATATATAPVTGQVVRMWTPLSIDPER